MSVSRGYKWFSMGDISSSATIVFDNLTNMAIIAFLLTVVFGMPAGIVLKHIIPGLSVGVVCANVVFIIFAFRLARRTGRTDVTAFPAGLDAPTCIGLTLSVVGPTFLLFKSQGMTPDNAALTSWYVSCVCCFFIGFVKFVTSFFVHKIKNLLPTVALLGGLAGVAVGLIAFMPLISMLQMPIISFVVLAIIMMVYFADYKLPANLPAILVAIVVGTICYYVFQNIIGGNHLPSLSKIEIGFPTIALSMFDYLPTAAKYFSVAFPFAMLVIFGTISVTESANVMGEDYCANSLLRVDGIATMLMGIFGGTAQTTPYAGFPAYKKMDARSGYLLINILLVGFGAWFGFVNYFIELIPEAVLAPVLLFIGVEIAMQVFLVSEKKYLPAAVLGLFPSIARMVEIKLSSNPDLVSMDKLHTMLSSITSGKLTDVAAIVTFGNGFIVTGTLWAALVYYMIDKRILAVVITSLILAALSMLGIIHSVNLDGSMYWIGNLAAPQQFIALEYVIGYLAIGVVSLIIHVLNRNNK